jgi:hypothetical protein
VRFPPKNFAIFWNEHWHGEERKNKLKVAGKIVKTWKVSRMFVNLTVLKRLKPKIIFKKRAKVIYYQAWRRPSAKHLKFWHENTEGLHSWISGKLEVTRLVFMKFEYSCENWKLLAESRTDHSHYWTLSKTILNKYFHI